MYWYIVEDKYYREIDIVSEAELKELNRDEYTILNQIDADEARQLIGLG